MLTRYQYANGRPLREEREYAGTYPAYYYRYNWHGDMESQVDTAGNGGNYRNGYGAWGEWYGGGLGYGWNAAWGYLASPRAFNFDANDVLDIGLYYVHGRWYNQDTGMWLSPNAKGDYMYGGDGQDAVNFALVGNSNLIDDDGYCRETLVECFKNNFKGLPYRKYFKDHEMVDWKEMQDLVDAVYADLLKRDTPPVWCPTCKFRVHVELKNILILKSDIPSPGYLFGWSSHRGEYDTPFWNGYGLPDTVVCFNGPGCYNRTEVNYFAQGMWGAASKVKGYPFGESEMDTYDVANKWKNEFGNFYVMIDLARLELTPARVRDPKERAANQTYDKALTPRAAQWLFWGYEYFESRYRREKSK